MNTGVVEGLRSKTSELLPHQTKTWASPAIFWGVLRNLAGEQRLDGVLGMMEQGFRLASWTSVVKHAGSPRIAPLHRKKSESPHRQMLHRGKH